jgi:hypothetical protein
MADTNANDESGLLNQRAETDTVPGIGSPRSQVHDELLGLLRDVNNFAANFFQFGSNSGFWAAEAGSDEKPQT